MTLSLYVVFMLGLVVEVLVLWNRAHQPQDGAQLWRLPFTTYPQGGWLGLKQFVIPGLFALAALLIAIFELTGVGAQPASMGNFLIGLLFALTLLFVLVFGVASDHLLPCVNEKSILVVEVLLITNALVNLLNGSQSLLSWITGLTLFVPLALALILALSRRGFSPISKAMVYWAYLFSLLSLTLNPENIALLKGQVRDFPDAFTAGSFIIFFYLHCLFLVRFTLIVSSLILPQNRPYIALMMPRLMGSEQIKPLHFFLFFAGMIAAAALNLWTGVFSMQALINLGILLGVALFSSSKPDAS